MVNSVLTGVYIYTNITHSHDIFNINTVYRCEYHVFHSYYRNVNRTVTGNKRGCTAITKQFQFTGNGSNSTVSFTEYKGLVIMRDICHSWTAPYTINYVAVALMQRY